MEQLLQNIPMTVVYLGDVLVTGRTAEKQDRNLQMVLSRLQEAGLRPKKKKIYFSADVVSRNLRRRHPSDTRQELRMHLHRRMPRSCTASCGSSTTTKPEHHLGTAPRANSPNCLMELGARQKKIIEEATALLFSFKVFVYYNPELPITVSSDASPGNVLSTSPIRWFVLPELSPHVKKNAQLEKEGLELVNGIIKFHTYLCGRVVD